MHLRCSFHSLLSATGVLVVLSYGLVAVTNAPLTDAIRQDDVAAVRAALRSGAGVDVRDESGTTPLMHAALLASPAVLRTLLDAGADVDAANAVGATALMWSVSRRANAELLVKGGADVNARAKNGWTALAAAARHRRTDVVRLLLLSGADIRSPESRRAALTAAYFSGDAAVRTVLREAGLDVTSASDMQGPVLNRARSDVATLRHLLNRGVPANEMLASNTIVLPTFFLAARAGQLDAVRAFAENGVDVTYRGARGTTALMLAAGSDEPNLDLLQDPIDRGTDLNVSDDAGRTALDWALTRGETDVAAFLRKAGARSAAVPTAPPPAVAMPRPAAAAIERALARLQPASKVFTDRTRCTSCHNEYIPGIALAMAARKGAAHDRPLAAHALTSTEENWGRRRELTVLGETLPATGLPPGLGYGLLERAAARKPATALTDALVIALASRQLPNGSWDGEEGIRPPLNGNVFAETALAGHALRTFGPAGHRSELARRVEQARRFLRLAPVADTQDHAFKLLGLQWSDAPKRDIQDQMGGLVSLQRSDGGWGQRPTLASDAYATGQTLYALSVAGMGAGDATYRKGVEYLLRTQLDDGTWFVRTRAFGVQPYFETGFPHGQHQFISATATAWAAIALTHTVQ